MNIGNIQLDSPVVLAPMAGYTDSALRFLCRRYGAGMTMTEVVNAEGLLHNSGPTFHLLETVAGESPVGAHLYGKDPGKMADAARVVEDLGRFAFIDINAGCPVRKIVAKGCGAALMKDPQRLGAIVAAMREAVCLPITVKTRSGPTIEAISVFDVAEAVQDNGGSAIMVHGRPTSRKHAGDADWDLLAELKKRVGVPVIGNGGVRVAEDVVRMLEDTGVDAVMIGRAAVGRPWIFSEAIAVLGGEEYEAPGPPEQRKVIMEHLDRLITLKAMEKKYRRKGSLAAEQAASLQFRAHLFKYLSGRPGWGSVRRRLDSINTPEAVMEAVDEAFDASGLNTKR